MWLLTKKKTLVMLLREFFSMYWSQAHASNNCSGLIIEFYKVLSPKRFCISLQKKNQVTCYSCLLTLLLDDNWICYCWHRSSQHTRLWQLLESYLDNHIFFYCLSTVSYLIPDKTYTSFSRLQDIILFYHSFLLECVPMPFLLWLK